MVSGKVKFYNVKNMFGFIAGDDGTDYFVHKSGLSRGLKLYEGDPVEFEVAEGQKGPKAVNVKKIGEANTPLESTVAPSENEEA